MKRIAFIIAGLLASFALGFYINGFIEKQAIVTNGHSIENTVEEKEDGMKLGAFSVSINVKDLETSRGFYENLGFEVLAGSMESSYLIMKNENALIGLFQGMFEGSILTFNPGWDENAQNIKIFQDVRIIQKQLKSKTIKLTAEADENTSGPASIMLADPDGNVIYIDQHGKNRTTFQLTEPVNLS